jgi:citrate lyase beta subunit
MKHNMSNPDFIFVHDPVEFDKFEDKDFLQYCLGATLYMPGTKKITDKIINKEINELTSMVMCFEDAVQEKDLPMAVENVLNHLDTLADAVDAKKITFKDIPLTFLRVRDLNQFEDFSQHLTQRRAKILSGFVFPKFYSSNGYAYFERLQSINEKLDVLLYGMPILEGKSIAYIETRKSELGHLKIIFDNFKDLLLNIRVGGTDFSSLFGVRRGVNYSIYDILTVRDCLSDILNFFNRSTDDYVISAPVWEYFLADSEEDIEHFFEEDIHRSILKRTPILNDAIDGLLREVVLDKANGFVGKTIIHPSHLKYVNGMQAISKEAYDDATHILQTKDGVFKSATSNKMNEVNPHRSWAKKIVNRAKAYGVIEDQAAYLKLFFGSKNR